MRLGEWLQLMADERASDLFFSVGAPPALKVEGATRYLGQAPATRVEIDALVAELTDAAQREAFARSHELDVARALPGIGRFRINLYHQRGEPAIAIRYITERIPSLDELGLPPLLAQLVMRPRGLVLVVGAAGSGKSTTLAAMVDHRNRRASGHILTIEDPIEFVHRHRASIVDQREVGIDTASFAVALRNAMREAPDLIVIGEIRDRETMQHAIAYAETGHLCLATLHANNASLALERIVHFFPEDARDQLLLDLSLNLEAVVSLRLVAARGGRRVPAVEVLLRTGHVSQLVAKGELAMLRDAMKAGRDVGMQTFDQALFDLWRAGRVEPADALALADSRNDLALAMRLDADGAPPARDAALAIEPTAEERERDAAPGTWIDDSLGSRAPRRSEP